MYQYLSHSGTPNRLLKALLYELHVQALSARKAGLRLLDAPGQEPWDDIQLLMSHSATVGTFLWPLDARRKTLNAAFPARHEVLRKITEVSADSEPIADLKPIKRIRDAMVHIDERFEQFMLDHPDDPLVLRAVGVHEHTTGNFLSWIPDSKMVSFFEERVEVEPLVALLSQVADKASKAMFLSMGPGDILAGDPFTESRPIPVLPIVPVRRDAPGM